nr:DUF6049 family protein [Motilibacter aurantiacus]
MAAAVLLLVPTLPAAPTAAAPTAAERAAAPLVEPSAEPSATPAAEAEATVTLSAVTPSVSGPGRDVTLSGYVVARVPAQDVTVRATVRSGAVPLVARVQLANAAGAGEPQGAPVAGTEAPVAERLAAGATARFSLRVPAAALEGDGEFGARALSVEARGTRTDTAEPTGPDRLGFVTTFVPWAPPGATPAATRLAWLWPLTDVPHRTADGTFLDDRLAASVGNNADGRPGRLRRLLDASAGWTVAVDPMLLEEVQALTAPYAVVGQRVMRPASSAAVAWLAEMRRRADAGSVLLLPYGDVDAASLVHAGKGGELETAMAEGAVTAAAVLGSAVPSTVAWPARSAVDTATADAYAAAGARTLVVSTDAVEQDPEASYTPSARATATGTASTGQGLLLADRLLSSTGVAGARGSTPGQRVLAVQRLLAETAVQSAERPNAARTMLIAPARGWSPDARLLEALNSAVRSAGWITRAPLADLAAEDPDGDYAAGELALAYPRRARAAELDPGYLETVTALGAQGARLASMLASTDEVQKAERRYRRERLGLESVSAGAVGPALVRRARGTLEARAGQVHVVVNRRISLPGSQNVPITVVNDLPDTVRVALTFTASPPRLRMGNTPVVRVAAGQTATVQVPAEVYANGNVRVTVRLITPRGQVVGEPALVTVSVRGARGAATVVVVAATALLVLMAVLRLVRRRRGGARAPGGPDPAPDDSAPDHAVADEDAGVSPQPAQERVTTPERPGGDT